MTNNPWCTRCERFRVEVVHAALASRALCPLCKDDDAREAAELRKASGWI